MKWRNRRQSDNVVDLRNITQVIFKWVDVFEDDGTTLFHVEITSDSRVSKFGNVAASSINVGLITAAEKDADGNHKLGEGHRMGIINLLKELTKTGRQIKVSADDGSVEELAVSTIRNLQG